METTRNVHWHASVPHSASPGPGAATGRLRNVGALLVAVFLVWVFMFVLAPFARQHPMVAPLLDYVARSGIDAGALYYTEIDETGEAEMYLSDVERFSPER